MMPPIRKSEFLEFFGHTMNITAGTTLITSASSVAVAIRPIEGTLIKQESAAVAPLSEAKQLETLLELQRDLALEANVEKVLVRITVAATTILDAERATLYVGDRTRNEL